MTKSLPILIFISFLTLAQESLAQQNIEIPTPSIELKENNLLISYDILKSQPSERFDIQVEIREEDGKLIDARSFSGDIGRSVSGGTNKTILWNLGKDEIYLNTDIYINVFAEKIEEISDKSSIPTKDMPVSSSAKKELNRTSLILQSVAIPGLGLTKVTGKPHWIKGLAAYSCLGGSIALNRAAIGTYDKFLTAETAETADALYSKSSTQDIISESLVYVAIGVLVSDMIWTIIGTSNLSGGRNLAMKQRILVNTGFDYASATPTLGFTYKF